MKKLLLLSVSIFSLLGSAYAQSVPYGSCDTFTLHKSNLVLHYNFSGTAPSSTIPDLSGNGHTGTRVGVIANVLDAGGNPDCALAFPGLANNHIKISSSTDFDFATHPATISLWYKAYETNAGKYEQLAGRGLSKSAVDHFGDYSLGLHDCRRPVAGINNAVCWDSVTIASPCDTGSFYRLQWNHVVVVFDNSGSGSVHPARVYLNGIVSTNWHSGTGPMSADTGNFYLGENFKGLMDEVRVYNTAFSPSDVSALYTYGIMGCCSPTGFGEISNENATISVYPNPATGSIRVDIPKQFTGGQVNIFNSLGQQVLHAAIKSDSEHLDLQQLPAGIYILDCSTATGDTHIRQIVTRL